MKGGSEGKLAHVHFQVNSSTVAAQQLRGIGGPYCTGFLWLSVFSPFNLFDLPVAIILKGRVAFALSV
jgi:hypothetical protein